MVALAMLVGCKHDPSGTPAVANVSGPAVAPTIPAGWVAIAVDEERLHCANYAHDEWLVAIEHGAVTLTESKQDEPDTGPALPFTAKPPQQVTPGRRHVLAVSDGFLVGFDAGEWGGALYWYSKDGSKSTKLGDENVHGLVKVAPDLVASIEGLSHGISSDGNVRWIEHQASWRANGLTVLDAAPSTFAATPEAIYIVTSESLARVDPKDRKATTIQPIRSARLYPDSMAIEPDGTLWIGMRQFVVRLTPDGNRFAETWLVRAACVCATVKDLSCVCAPS